MNRSLYDVCGMSFAGTVDLFEIEKVRRIACFPQKALMIGNSIASFADSTAACQFDPALLHYLYSRVPEAVLPSDDCISFALPHLYRSLQFEKATGNLTVI